MTARFDKRQAKCFLENVGYLHCFLSETIATARTFLHLSHKFSFVYDRRTKTRRIDRRWDVWGDHKGGGKDLGYHANINEGKKWSWLDRLSKVRSRSGLACFWGPRTRTSGPGPANSGHGPGPASDLVLGPDQVRSGSGPGHQATWVLQCNDFFLKFVINIQLKKL